MTVIKKIYLELLKNYGPQGWWPTTKLVKNKIVVKYHKGIYTIPKNKIFEVCIGAILTQNTSWKNVEKSLIVLKQQNLLSPIALQNIDIEILKKHIKSSGYFNQKAKKLKIFADFFIRLKGKTPTRTELLAVWGIGKETADSILLYAYNVPVFVVDVYTKRLFANLGILKGNEDYDFIAKMFDVPFKKNLKSFQEYHALIVEHGKNKFIFPRRNYVQISK